MNKSGRIDKNNVKSSRIGLRTNPEHKKEWERMAQSAGLSLSAWIEYWLEVGTNIQVDLTRANKAAKI